MIFHFPHKWPHTFIYVSNSKLYLHWCLDENGIISVVSFDRAYIGYMGFNLKYPTSVATARLRKYYTDGYIDRFGYIKLKPGTLDL